VDGGPPPAMTITTKGLSPDNRIIRLAVLGR
jgi:hypothetical protein